MPTSLFAVLALAFYLVAMKMALNLVLDSNFDDTPEERHYGILIIFLSLLVLICLGFIVLDVIDILQGIGIPSSYTVITVILASCIFGTIGCIPADLFMWRFEIREKIFKLL